MFHYKLSYSFYNNFFSQKPQFLTSWIGKYNYRYTCNVLHFSTQYPLLVMCFCITPILCAYFFSLVVSGQRGCPGLLKFLMLVWSETMPNYTAMLQSKIVRVHCCCHWPGQKVRSSVVTSLQCLVSFWRWQRSISCKT